MKRNEDVRQRADNLLSALTALKEDRGAMANLRRAATPATEHYAWPWLARWCRLENDNDRCVTSTIAAAFAAHPETCAKGNFGDTLRRIAIGDKGGKDVEEGLKSFEARFRRLLTCATRKEICQRVPGIVRAAAQRGIPLNYAQLFEDLTFWSDHVKRRWAAEYWQEAQEGSEAP